MPDLSLTEAKRLCERVWMCGCGCCPISDDIAKARQSLGLLIAECERLRREVHDLRSATIQACDLGTSLYERKIELAAIREVANDTSAHFDWERVEAEERRLRAIPETRTAEAIANWLENEADAHHEAYFDNREATDADNRFPWEESRQRAADIRAGKWRTPLCPAWPLAAGGSAAQGCVADSCSQRGR